MSPLPETTRGNPTRECGCCMGATAISMVTPREIRVRTTCSDASRHRGHAESYSNQCTNLWQSSPIESMAAGGPWVGNRQRHFRRHSWGGGLARGGGAGGRAEVQHVDQQQRRGLAEPGARKGSCLLADRLLYKSLENLLMGRHHLLSSSGQTCLK